MSPLFWVDLKVHLGFSITSCRKTGMNFLAYPINKGFSELIFSCLKMGCLGRRVIIITGRKADAGRVAIFLLLLNGKFIHQVVGWPPDCPLKSFLTVTGLLGLREHPGPRLDVKGDPVTRYLMKRPMWKAWALDKELMREIFLCLTFSAINEQFEFQRTHR